MKNVWVGWIILNLFILYVCDVKIKIRFDIYLKLYFYKFCFYFDIYLVFRFLLFLEVFFKYRIFYFNNEVFLFEKNIGKNLDFLGEGGGGGEI